MPSHSITRYAIISLVAGLFIVPSAAAQTAAEDIATRADELARELELRRQDLNIPGMALAIVKDGEVILARGFGLADVDEEAPVTADTIFAIGSTTKAFTSTVIGMLVDEGLMNWDDPVASHLPYFTLDLDTDDEDAEPLITDLLAHRTGFARMSILWAAGKASPEEVLRAATRAEPWDGFRENFHYNNVMYLAAGVAAGEAAGSDWTTLIHERIFQPLNMKEATTSVRAAQQNPKLASGYLWDEEREIYERQSMRHLDSIAPAGAINASVVEMANWLRFLLADGVYDGKRLISSESLQKTWSPQVELAPGVAYGRGWFVRQWRGMTVIEHGGNIDGFAAQVALLPEKNLGFVLLANISATPLQQGSMSMVWEALLPEDVAAEVDDSEGDASEFAECLGEYIADFPPFDDDRVTVLEQEGRLAIDVPDQGVYVLAAPDEQGRRSIVNGPPAAVSFARNDDGRVVALILHQGGLDLEMPRAGIERKAEIPLEELSPYLGSYHFHQMGVDFEVLIQNKRLAVDVPGQMVYELHPPDDEGKWVFRASDAIAVSFKKSDGGRVSSMTLHQGGMDFEMPRVGAGERDPDLPTLAEIQELRRSAERQSALERLGVVHLSGDAFVAQAGVEGEINWWFDAGDRYKQETTFGRFGYVTTIVNGDRAATESDVTPSGVEDGREARRMSLDHPAIVFGDFTQFVDDVSVEGREEINERQAIRLRLTRADLDPVTLYLDEQTGDVLRTRTMLPVGGGMGSIPVTTDFSDHREAQGLRVAFEMSITNPATGRTDVTFHTFEVVENPGPALFAIPDEEDEG